jgi:hypothetical protein
LRFALALFEGSQKILKIEVNFPKKAVVGLENNQSIPQEFKCCYFNNNPQPQCVQPRSLFKIFLITFLSLIVISSFKFSFIFFFCIPVGLLVSGFSVYHALKLLTRLLSLLTSLLLRLVNLLKIVVDLLLQDIDQINQNRNQGNNNNNNINHQNNQHPRPHNHRHRQSAI